MILKRLSLSHSEQIPINCIEKITTNDSRFSLSLYHVPQDEILCYKMFPGETFKLSQSGPDKKETHWSHSIYCQLTYNLSFDYLPNRWDEGDTASLYQLTPKHKKLTVLIVEGSLLSDNKLPSTEKGNLIFNAIKEYSTILTTSNETCLLRFLGENNCLFCGVDADTHEVAIPKTLLNEDHFELKKLLDLKKHPHYPVTSKYKKAEAEQWQKAISDDDAKTLLTSKESPKSSLYSFLTTL